MFAAAIKIYLKVDNIVILPPFSILNHTTSLALIGNNGKCHYYLMLLMLLASASARYSNNGGGGDMIFPQDIHVFWVDRKKFIHAGNAFGKFSETIYSALFCF